MLSPAYLNLHSHAAELVTILAEATQALRIWEWIVHRDLEASNILLTGAEACAPKIADFRRGTAF